MILTNTPLAPTVKNLAAFERKRTEVRFSMARFDLPYLYNFQTALQ